MEDRRAGRTGDLAAGRNARSAMPPSGRGQMRRAPPSTSSANPSTASSSDPTPTSAPTTSRVAVPSIATAAPGRPMEVSTPSSPPVLTPGRRCRAPRRSRRPSPRGRARRDRGIDDRRPMLEEARGGVRRGVEQRGTGAGGLRVRTVEPMGGDEDPDVAASSTAACSAPNVPCSARSISRRTSPFPGRRSRPASCRRALPPGPRAARRCP